MKRSRWITIPLLLLALAACAGSNPLTGAETPTPFPPEVTVIPTPSVGSLMQAYLDAFVVEDYPAMYAMLTSASQQAYSQEAFQQHHVDDFNAMSVQSIEANLLSEQPANPERVNISFRVTYRTVLFGDIQRAIAAEMIFENGAWRLQWDTGLILPELAGGKHLSTNYRPPSRGDIYDRDGDAIATQADAYALGIIPGQILLDEEEAMLVALYQVTGLRPDTIRALYANYYGDMYAPVTEISAEDANVGYLASFGGLYLEAYTSRYYQNGGIGPQAVGYTQFISTENYNEYRRRGYSGAERIGSSGIEKWGEEYLAGRSAATLHVVDQEGTILTQLASAEPIPAQSITLTIDDDLQYQAQQAFNGLPGAAVVIEVDTGRVLAMVSSPGFDPNLFDPENINSIAAGNLLNDPNRPLLNRATQGTYPLGSVFKIITMAAALESGSFTIENTYDCQYEFTELGATNIKRDWTWQHCQDELQRTGQCTTQPSGMLTLPEGLMRSCNPWFYHIGLAFYNQGNSQLITDMALGFGLGAPTGIGQVTEAAGNVPYPVDGNDATNIATGQGDVQVTPLQVAVFTAALANGGSLYRPQIVETVQPVSGEPTYQFAPQTNGTLPVSQENLEILRAAMIEVVRNPRGTANYSVGGLQIPVAGKTGTAETDLPLYPHAWFTGYTMADNPDKPDIAVAVFVPYIGEGSYYAAPIFRRIVEIYFYGRPQSVYRWESNIGITETPTPYGGIPTPVP